MTDNTLLQQPYGHLLNRHPHVRDFFSAFTLPEMARDQSLNDLLDRLTPDQKEDLGVSKSQFIQQFFAFMEQVDSLKQQRDVRVGCITVMGGRNKDGNPEEIRLELHAGEVVSVVGPTGAGKSMLLADIESLAQGDTPSGRRILVDGRVPDDVQRLSGEHRLIAQLSQNMNFVMDLSVREFLEMHAQSRLVENIDDIVEQILTTAVCLAGEPFGPDTPVTALSGGQSRALMIADVAGLSASPIVLIDEIENAGVDRRQALNLLVKKEKIVLLATHDPLLALSSSRRVVIRNGGIESVLETTPEEQALLRQLDGIDARLAALRHQIRQGDRLDTHFQI